MKVFYNMPLKRFTSLRVGGPADVFIIVDDLAELVNLIKCVSFALKNFHLFVLGGGSNLLVSDDGVEGITIKLGDKFKTIKIISCEGSWTRIRAGAALFISELIKFCILNGLSGLETLSGIPGTIGGAIFMNAGAYGVSISDCLESVTFVDSEGKILCVRKGDPEFVFSYRVSPFLSIFKNSIITEAIFILRKEKKENVLSTAYFVLKKRKQSQPQFLAPYFFSAGCFFRNPLRNQSAAKFIEQAGLKGVQIGSARVSPEHANFLINLGNATAKDFLDLINIITSTVYKKFSIQLELEICLVGKGILTKK